MSDTIKELQGAILRSVKSKTGDFLDNHQNSREFMEDRSKRMAELVERYAVASDEDEREAIKRRMEAVTLALGNEALVVAADMAPAAKSLFRDVAEIVFGAAKELAPAIIKSLRKD